MAAFTEQPATEGCKFSVRWAPGAVAAGPQGTVHALDVQPFPSSPCWYLGWAGATVQTGAAFISQFYPGSGLSKKYSSNTFVNKSSDLGYTYM